MTRLTTAEQDEAAYIAWIENGGPAKAQAKHDQLAVDAEPELTDAGWRILEKRMVMTTAQSFYVVELVIRRAQVVRIVRWHTFNKGWFEADRPHGNGIFLVGTA